MVWETVPPLQIFSSFKLTVTEIAKSSPYDPSSLPGQYKNEELSLPLGRWPTSPLTENWLLILKHAGVSLGINKSLADTSNFINYCQHLIFCKQANKETNNHCLLSPASILHRYQECCRPETAQERHSPLWELISSKSEREVIIHSYSEMFNITEFLASSLLPQGDAGIHRYSFRITLWILHFILNFIVQSSPKKSK